MGEIEAARVDALPPAHQKTRREHSDVDSIQPHWLAARVTAFSVECHWSEEFILLRLGLSRAEQYYHALLKRMGWRTYLPKPSVEMQLTDAHLEAADFPVLPDDPELAEAVARFGAAGSDTPPPV